MRIYVALYSLLAHCFCRRCRRTHTSVSFAVMLFAGGRKFQQKTILNWCLHLTAAVFASELPQDFKYDSRITYPWCFAMICAVDVREGLTDVESSVWVGVWINLQEYFICGFRMPSPLFCGLHHLFFGVALEELVLHCCVSKNLGRCVLKA